MAAAMSAFAAPPRPPQLSSALPVEAFRVAPLFDEHYTTSKRLRGQKLVAGPRQLSPADAAALAQQLEQVYRVDWPSSYCAFAPRYAVRFHLADGLVDVLLCPHCGEVHFYHGESSSICQNEPSAMIRRR